VLAVRCVRRIAAARRQMLIGARYGPRRRCGDDSRSTADVQAYHRAGRNVAAFLGSGGLSTGAGRRAAALAHGLTAALKDTYALACFGYMYYVEIT
jgi:hypothetical protein